MGKTNRQALAEKAGISAEDRREMDELAKPGAAFSDEAWKAFEKQMREDSGERQTWRPEPGDFIVGVLAHRRDNVLSRTMAAEEYEPCIVLTLDVPRRGFLDVWCIHTVLRNEVIAVNPQPGEVYGIKYFGERVPAGGTKGYHHWTIRRMA